MQRRGSAAYETFANRSAGGGLNGVVLLAVPAHVYAEMDVGAEVRMVSFNVGLIVLAESVGIDGDAPNITEGVFAFSKGASVYKFGVM